MNKEPLSIVEKGPSVKIAVIGKGVVGKSSLTCRFINYNAPQDHDPTIEDRYKSTISIEDIKYEVEILDTAGEEDYQNMMDMWVNFGEGFLLVFAINDRESFEVLKKKRERIKKGKGEKLCPMILVGNKQDLKDERQVDINEAQSLANEWGIDYIETSAKTNYQCGDAFQRLAAKVVAMKKGGNIKVKTCPCNCNII